MKYSLFIMFTSSFVFQYFFMSLITSNNSYNITNSLSKLYLSIIMAIFMVIVEMCMFTQSRLYTYILFIILFIVFIYLYKNQIFVNDKQYLNDMIEHHSMALLTSKKILEKSENKQVLYLANNIINNQEKEIKKMKYLLKNA